MLQYKSSADKTLSLMLCGKSAVVYLNGHVEGIVHPKWKKSWKCIPSQAIQDVEEFVFSHVGPDAASVYINDWLIKINQKIKLLF